MTFSQEYTKMLAGEPYDSTDAELKTLRLRARNLIFRFNQSRPDNLDVHNQILCQLLGSVGDDCHIEPPFYCDYGKHIHLGNHCYLNFNCILLDCADIHIGHHAMFGPGVQLYAAYHPIQAKKRIEGLELAAPIKIGDNCWIGGGALICQGTEIGENTTIGAGSVVTKSIPANVFAAGNPCKVIRELSNEQ